MAFIGAKRPVDIDRPCRRCYVVLHNTLSKVNLLNKLFKINFFLIINYNHKL